MSLTPPQIAAVCHAANRVLQDVSPAPGIPVAPLWADLDPEGRASVINGVLAAMTGNTPEQSHANWCAFKREHGWVYGPTKDDTAKTHPCLVDYADLSAADKRKDHLFTAIVRALT